MSYNLFLDDFRTPQMAFHVTPDSRYNVLQWKTAKSYDEFVKLIAHYGMPQLVAFDHDLADIHYAKCQRSLSEQEYDQLKEKTGFHAAKHLVNLCVEQGLDIPEYLIHTQNYHGGKAILSVMETGKKILKLTREAKERGETIQTLPDYTKPQ